MSDIFITIVRPLWIGGQQVATGARISLAPLAAAPLLDSGKAQLIDQRDAETVLQAVTDDTRRLSAAAALDLGYRGSFTLNNTN